MGIQEPGFGLLGKALAVALVLVSSASFAVADDLNLGGYFQVSTGWRAVSPDNLGQLVKGAEGVLSRQLGQGMRGNAQIRYVPEAIVGNPKYASVRFRQFFGNVEVFGSRAAVHYRGDKVTDVTRRNVSNPVNLNPVLSPEDAFKVVRDYFQLPIQPGGNPRLKIYRDTGDRYHLAYRILTRSAVFGGQGRGRVHHGRVVFVDAQTGELIMIYKRAYDIADDAKITVFSADTEAAHQHVDPQGYPRDINFSWYDKVIENGNHMKRDDSAERAWMNSGLVYDYFRKTFNRKSYDDQDSPLVSIVHMGVKMNNAFWTDEFKIMAYGDGDGDHLVDLTLGVDVAAHELTHGIISNTARLEYAAEAGALNEAYADFFGKMVDQGAGNWYIGEKIIGPKWKPTRFALRNMKSPEEFKQPGSNDSPLRIPTTGMCSSKNDYCGVHTNSGIPNRASVLIVESIGKPKAEQLYYKVLTSRLSENSTFRDARLETEKECERMFGAGSSDCAAVKAAFDTVKM